MKTKLSKHEALKNFPKKGGKDYYFANKPPGHRCAWSVRWECYKKSVMPGDWCSVENMTDRELMLELEDVIARTHVLSTHHFIAGAYERARAGHEKADKAALLQYGADLDAIRDYLRTERDRYPAYIYHPNPPENVVLDETRPGWPET